MTNRPQRTRLLSSHVPDHVCICFNYQYSLHFIQNDSDISLFLIDFSDRTFFLRLIFPLTTYLTWKSKYSDLGVPQKHKRLTGKHLGRSRTSADAAVNLQDGLKRSTHNLGSAQDAANPLNAIWFWLPLWSVCSETNGRGEGREDEGHRELHVGFYWLLRIKLIVHLAVLKVRVHMKHLVVVSWCFLLEVLNSSHCWPWGVCVHAEELFFFFCLLWLQTLTPTRERQTRLWASGRVNTPFCYIR